MTEDEKSEKVVAQTRRLSGELSKLNFPNLLRPQPTSEGVVTLDLIYWAVRFYVYSVLSHFREMIRSFLFLGDDDYVPAAFVILRCLFEIGAQTYYVHKHLIQFLNASDLWSAWNFLYEINMGSLYIRTGKNGTDYPRPRHIGKVVRSFDEWGHATDYKFLSEFAHPNMGAFSQYYQFVKRDSEEIEICFSRNFSDDAFPDMSKEFVTTLHFCLELLNLTGETESAGPLKEILLGYVAD
jgi:hypothetical protein